MMEYDPATSDQGILESSYEEVDRAHAYLVLISNWRYGRILDVADNPQNWSVTELEFRRAEAPNKTKLDAFRTHTSHHNRITADEASTPPRVRSAARPATASAPMTPICCCNSWRRDRRRF